MEEEGKRKAGRNGRKKLGAAAMAVLCGIPMLAFLAFILLALGRGGGAADGILAVYAAVILCALVGLSVVLVQRFKEINSGEEDESLKY